MRNKNKISVTQIANHFFEQQLHTRAAFEKVYFRRLTEIDDDFSKRICMSRINEVDDLYLVTEYLDFKGTNTSSESWNACYSWSTRQLVEIAGKLRIITIDTVNGILLLDLSDQYPYTLETYSERKLVP